MGSYNPKKLRKFLFAMILMFVLAFAAVKLLPDDAFAQSLSMEEALDQFIEGTAKTLGIPGVSVAISHQGELIYSQVFGEGINKDTRFYIGSVSKSFTALAIMQLVEQGSINLDESVSAYVEEFTLSNEITVRHLLHHVSGMTEADYLTELPPDADPNYSLLGLLIERVSGQSYEQYLAEQIINPLELTQTSLTGEVDTSGHLSFFGFSIRRQEPFVKYDLPAGFITSSAEDLVRYLEAVRMRQPVLNVSAAGIREMEAGTPYAMGWMAGTIANRPAVHHGGALPGFAANAVMLTEDEYSIALLLNKNHMLNGMVFYPDLTNGIVSILTDQERTTTLHYFWIFRLLIILFAFTFVANLRKLKKLILAPVPQSMTKRVVAALINLLLPVAIIVFVPIIFVSVLARGMTWDLALLLMPDLITWMFMGLAFKLLEAGNHIVYITKYYLSRRKTVV